MGAARSQLGRGGASPRGAALDRDIVPTAVQGSQARSRSAEPQGPYRMLLVAARQGQPSSYGSGVMSKALVTPASPGGTVSRKVPIGLVAAPRRPGPPAQSKSESIETP